MLITYVFCNKIYQSFPVITNYDVGILIDQIIPINTDNCTKREGCPSKCSMSHGNKQVNVSVTIGLESRVQSCT